MLLAMKEEYARQIAGWEYEGRYSLYSLNNNEETIRRLMDGRHFVYLTMDRSEIVGFFAVEESARVELMDYTYDDSSFDLAMGMRPDLCGRGLGANFLQAGINFFREEYGETSFRITVVSKNIRARKLFEKLDFKIEGRGRHRRTIDEFLIYERDF